MTLWRLLDTETTYDAARNLAIDEAILEARARGLVPPTVRFWRNEGAVVVGYSQDIRHEVNLEICKYMGFQIVRRPSGGGAVYHDLGNLNYTMVLDADSNIIKGLDIVKSYEILCSGLLKGLRSLGVDADLVPPGNIHVRGKKISGSAQLRRKNIVLHHGTLLVDSNLQLLGIILLAGCRETYSTSVWSTVTNLKNEMVREISLTEVKSALIRGFKEAFRIRVELGEITPFEIEIAEKFYREKYSQDEWNLRSSSMPNLFRVSFAGKPRSSHPLEA